MNQLHLVVRTPREVVLDVQASSIRIPTDSGQVGMRPRVEPLVVAVEPGLVLVRRAEQCTFVGTAGGLLRCDGATASLLTPLAVISDDEAAVLDGLEEAMGRPSVEMDVRATLSRLQRAILRELRDGGSVERRGSEDAR